MWAPECNIQMWLLNCPNRLHSPHQTAGICSDSALMLTRMRSTGEGSVQVSQVFLHQTAKYCHLTNDMVNMIKIHLNNVRLKVNPPARWTGVRPCWVSVVRGDAPWLRRVWTQSVCPRRAARAKGVLPASSRWSTSVSPCSSTSRAWAWPWYACKDRASLKTLN